MALSGWCFVIGLTLLPAAPSLARQLIAKSGTQRVNVVELFSSESCSSCPPADDWLGQLQNNKNLFKTFVPLAFHVDYWNKLNWIDRYSTKQMTQRQIDVTNQWEKPALYTPGVVINGKEYRSWRDGKLPVTIEVSPLEISILKNSEFNFSTDVKFSKKTSDGKKYNLRVAILGMGIETDVQSGENGGKKLKHNFLVLNWSTQALNGTLKNHFSFEKPKQRADRFAVVAWIEEQGQVTPVQAVGGFL